MSCLQEAARLAHQIAGRQGASPGAAKLGVAGAIILISQPAGVVPVRSDGTQCSAYGAR